MVGAKRAIEILETIKSKYHNNVIDIHAIIK